MMEFSKFELFHKEEQELIKNHTQLVLSAVKAWAPKIKQVNAIVNASVDDKVALLMGSNIGKKLVSLTIKETALKNLLTKFFEKNETMDVLLQKFETIAETYITNKELEMMREPLTNIIPKAVLDFLPKNLVVDIDPEGVIEDVYTRFQNKDKNLGVKVQKQKDFMIVKDKFEKLLGAGMASPIDTIKIMSVLISVMYETGIRPASDPDTTLSHVRTTPLYPKDFKDKATATQKAEASSELNALGPSSVTTYGALTLLPSHARVLDEYSWEGSGVQLSFYGKSGQLNWAEVRGSQATKIIKELIEEFNKNPHGGPLFSLNNGKPITFAQLTSFYTKLLISAGMDTNDITGHSLTDLRKLKASTTLHEVLVRYQEEFYDNILALDPLQIMLNNKESLKSLSKLIVEYLKKAVEGAEMALNHSSMNMTINSYINPQVILSFLSHGGNVPQDFKELVHDKFQLKFDLKDFVIQATQSKLIDPTGWIEAVGLERLGVLGEERDEFAKEFSLLRIAKQKKIKLASIIKVIAKLQRNIR